MRSTSRKKDLSLHSCSCCSGWCYNEVVFLRPFLRIHAENPCRLNVSRPVCVSQKQTASGSLPAIPTTEMPPGTLHGEAELRRWLEKIVQHENLPQSSGRGKQIWQAPFYPKKHAPVEKNVRQHNICNFRRKNEFPEAPGRLFTEMHFANRYSLTLRSFRISRVAFVPRAMAILPPRDDVAIPNALLPVLLFQRLRLPLVRFARSA